MEINVEPGYEPLARVLVEALEQCQHGKGRERHANDKPFAEQPMITIRQDVGRGFTLGQIIKKAEEVQNIPKPSDQVQELLSIINYAAGEVICIEKEMQDRQPPRIAHDLRISHNLHTGYTHVDLVTTHE